MNTVISIILTLLVFTLIVVIHEGGHFLMARCMGVYVEEFSIGMGPCLFKHRTKKNMQFSLRALPVGGYCKMKGEEQEEGVQPEPDSFVGKKPWRRALIVAAGPMMNFVLAFVLALILNCFYGYIETKVTKVDADYPAAQAGMEAGDTIYALNGERIHTYSQVTFDMYFYEAGDPVVVVVKKASGEKLAMKIVPQYDEEAQKYRIGFTVGMAGTLSEMIREEGFFPAVGDMISQSFWDTCYYVESTVRSIGLIFSGKVGLDGLSGPIGIVSVVDDTYTEAASYGFWTVAASMAELCILISANLGVLNLFPIPGLDGSHLVFLLVEKIRRKPLNAKVENAIYTAGFVLLFGLMILVAINDIIRLIP